jgi:hypothetical protein
LPVLAGVLALPAGCGREMTSGCTPPPNEARLLDEYARDPVFAIRPARVRDVAPIQHTAACRIIKGDAGPDEVSVASAWFALTPVDRHDRAALIDLYDAEVTGHGWRAAPRTATPAPTASSSVLRYCKSIRGVTSYLEISSFTGDGGDAVVVGPGAGTPSQAPLRVLFQPISVRILAAPDEPACPESGD